MPIRFRGSIILLIDEKTSSAADEFAVFCKSTGWATVVGETSGGGGIGGDPALIQLPQSGIIVRYPALTGFNPDGTLNIETRTTPNMCIGGLNPDERLENLIKIVRKLTSGGLAIEEPSPFLHYWAGRDEEPGDFLSFCRGRNIVFQFLNINNPKTVSQSDKYSFFYNLYQ